MTGEDLPSGEVPDLPDLGELPPSRTNVVVLTPVRSAQALAALCALQGVALDVVPSSRGALATSVVERDPFDIDPEEMLSGIPAAAADIASTLSVVARAGVVLLTARIEDADGEIAGHVHARRFTGGQPGEDVPPGLILASADDVVERLLLGRVRAEDVSGHIDSGSMPRKPLRRLPSLRRRRRGKDADGTGDGSS
ncbi:conserved hypothetical protein [Beutenbergia cavernae DSM 12333]|uniref:Uncharacterized protein n=1 Tax=Beutenbergia cavernae (strain ATCC BAA-8 / DSM 12333 / CCUG 43141 / JCM 11478 / NBRC 16432 / NCIMB 13614 / HKI 0122) TaxID=471853 RepID=C5BW40_BEUC1|nr:hypothetical protein [Beutenbergia cavernae]ACQ80641.1 conserved hypothetical protein [Beutenbergia cavernae DSM 12333]